MSVPAGHMLFVGFMGSGKTSVARRLSTLTGLSLIDVDQRIESIAHCSIPALFEAEGEAGFRQRETAVLKGLAGEPRSIVSCGGGIVCTPENRRVLATLGCTIYLFVDYDEALERISSTDSRPLLNGARPARDLYTERLPLYDEVADLVVDTSGLSIYRVALQCEKLLKGRGLL